jgi:predicted nucleotidyltransferase
VSDDVRQPTDAGPTGLEPVLARVRDSLGSVPGVVALALGGSRARGTAYEDSDVDIGLYYEPARRPDFDELYAAAAELDDRGVPDGYGSYGEWGPWVNGGLWLQVAGKRMDILLRDTAHHHGATARTLLLTGGDHAFLNVHKL